MKQRRIIQKKVFFVEFGKGPKVLIKVKIKYVRLLHTVRVIKLVFGRDLSSS